MNILKAIVVDDERLARKELITMLKEFKEISIVSEVDNVNSAIDVIEKYNPDIIFLDIQMPGKSGFDLLNLIEITGKVIFVTAYDEYAIRAFEINALDYLLKPINPERLRKSIERLKMNIIEKDVILKQLSYDDHLLLNINSRLRFIKIESISLISSAGDYSEIIFGEGQKGLTLKTMKEWEKRLPTTHFCRIHRSTIINIERVRKIDSWYNNSYLVSLNGIEKPVIMSRRYYAQIKDRLG
jgi:two-component system, LytTR family, response regulator